MRRYEKIILVIYAIVFGLQLINFKANYTLFILSTLLLALSYLLGGFWLLNTKGNKNLPISIIAGIVFASSIYNLPFLVGLNRKDYLFFLPIVNGVLLMYLLVYAYVNRKEQERLQSIRLIIIRSSIILFVISIFTYTPYSFKTYRNLIYVLNTSNKQLQNNLLAIDYTEVCDDAIKKGSCNRAIEYGLKAHIAGITWLSIKYKHSAYIDKAKEIISSLENNSTYKNENLSSLILPFANESTLSFIEKTHHNLYEAFTCKANQDFNNNKLEEALENYSIANSYLITSNPESNYWKEQKVWSLNNIGLCYLTMRNYSIADSVFSVAIEEYKLIKGNNGDGLATLYRNLAISLSKEFHISYSNSLYQAANEILLKDTVNKSNKKYLASNYNSLTKNYFYLDSLQNALHYIKEAISSSNGIEEAYYCQALFNYGSYYFKIDEYQKSDSVFKICLDCFKRNPINNNQTLAACYLALGQVGISLAKYDDVRKYLDNWVEITSNNYGKEDAHYAKYLILLAQLNNAIGKYTNSEKQYNTAIKILSSDSGSTNNIHPTVYTELAQLEVTLGKFHLAKTHSDSLLLTASSEGLLNYPSAANLLNTAAYVNYCLGIYKPADTLYRKVITINNNYGLKTPATTAIALNGLGLLEVDKRNYSKADSLFNNSLRMHQIIYSDNHPMTAIVYLNYGKLLTLKGNLTDAEDKIYKALQINKQFFNQDHDIFADISSALADIAKKKNQQAIAVDYYQKALDIYTRSFDESHWKVISTRQKIRVITNKIQKSNS